MKTLIFMRHGDAPFNDAMERPLSKLGHVEAANIGVQLQQYWDECAGRGQVDYVLYSWTERTTDTLAQVSQNCPYYEGVEARALKQLEHASPSQVLDMILKLDDSISSLMIVGHDTYLATIMGGLSTRESLKEFASFARRFTHAQCVIIEHEDIKSWSDIQPQSFKVKAGFRPSM